MPVRDPRTMMRIMAAISRRDVLRLGVLAAAAAGGGAMGGIRAQPRPAIDAIDHLLLGAADLDRAIAWVEERTGVRAAIGGSHPGRGTRNALLSLGGRHYLEIIAPDPAQTGVDPGMGLRGLGEPRLVTWAASTRQIEALAASARTAHLRVRGPQDGARVRPDGKTLRWKTLAIENDVDGPAIAPIPFFIEWSADTRHPSEDSPAGCRLLSFALRHPDPARVRALLEPLGLNADVQRGDAGLTAVISTPHGTVTLD